MTSQLSRRIGIAILCAVLTFCLAELAVRWLVTVVKPELSFSKEFDFKFDLASKASQDKRPSIVFLGNSKMNRALYPELLEARLKQHQHNDHVLNLALDGGTPALATYLIKQMVKSGQKPTVVVFQLDISYFDTASQEDRGNVLMQRSYLGQCVIHPPKQWNNQMNCFLKQHSYLMRYQAYLNYLLDTKNLGVDLVNPRLLDNALLSSVRAYQASPNGWALEYAVHAEDDFSPNAYDPKHIEDSPVEKRFNWNNKSFGALIQYTKAQGIPLLLVWMPEYNMMYYKHTAYFEQRFGRLAQQYHVAYIKMYDRKNNFMYFADNVHLNAVGAVAFTERIGQLLLSSPYKEWLTLRPSPRRSAHAQ